MQADEKRATRAILGKFGEYLQEARASCGRPERTQRAIAQIVDTVLRSHDVEVRVTQSLLAQYEQGIIRDPDPRVLHAIASVLGVDYLKMIVSLIHEKYAPLGGTWAGGPCWQERWDVLEATWLQPNRIGEVFDEDGCRVRDGVADLEREQIIAKAALVRDGVFLGVKGMAEYERRLDGVQKIWVIAPEFLADGDADIAAAVVANLLKEPPVKYRYFLPRKFARRFEKYVARLAVDERLVARAVSVADHVAGYAISDEILRWLPTDHLIVNPHPPSRAVGFRYLRVKGRLFAYLMGQRELAAFLESCMSLSGPETPLQLVAGDSLVG